MVGYGEDGAVGFHIISCILVYAFLAFGLSRLIGLFLLFNCPESQKPLKRKQISFVIEKVTVYAGMSLVIGAIFFFIIFFTLLIISENLFDINSIIYSILNRQFFVLALLMASVNCVLIFYIFFHADSYRTLKQFLELSEDT